MEIERYEAGRARDRQLATLKQNVEQGTQQNTDVQLVAPREDTGKARDKAAEAVGVNHRYVQEAKKIVAEAPQYVERIERGEMTIPEAIKEIKMKL